MRFLTKTAASLVMLLLVLQLATSRAQDQPQTKTTAAPKSEVKIKRSWINCYWSSLDEKGQLRTAPSPVNTIAKREAENLGLGWTQIDIAKEENLPGFLASVGGQHLADPFADRLVLERFFEVEGVGIISAPESLTLHPDDSLAKVRKKVVDYLNLTTPPPGAGPVGEVASKVLATEPQFSIILYFVPEISGKPKAKETFLRAVEAENRAMKPLAEGGLGAIGGTRNIEKYKKDYLEHLGGGDDKDVATNLTAKATADALRPFVDNGWAVLFFADPKDREWSFGPILINPSMNEFAQIRFAQAQHRALRPERYKVSDNPPTPNTVQPGSQPAKDQAAPTPKTTEPQPKDTPKKK